MDQPKLPQAFFDEFGKGADDRVLDYGRECALAALSAIKRNTYQLPRDGSGEEK